MALRIPRFDRTLPLVEEARTPTPMFHQWWDSVAKTIEDSVNNIISILVRLGLVEITADGALSLSQSAINPDGTIKSSKVVTDSINANAVTERYFSQNLSSIEGVNGVELDIVSLSVTKVEDESSVDVDTSFRISSDNDLQGTIRLYRDATLIDSFFTQVVGDGTNDTNLCVTLPFTDIDPVAGTYLYKATFQQSSASPMSIGAGTLLRAKEFKR